MSSIAASAREPGPLPSKLNPARCLSLRQPGAAHAQPRRLRHPSRNFCAVRPWLPSDLMWQRGMISPQTGGQKKEQII